MINQIMKAKQFGRLVNMDIPPMSVKMHRYLAGPFLLLNSISYLPTLAENIRTAHLKQMGDEQTPFRDEESR